MLNGSGARNIQIIDSSGARILIATGTDSAGKPITFRQILPVAPPASSTAFVSGTAPMQVTLDAFASGQLKTYGQVSAMTKTDGWSLTRP
jgi:hypothetical protein